jgi:hypothetical protein
MTLLQIAREGNPISRGMLNLPSRSIGLLSLKIFSPGGMLQARFLEKKEDKSPCASDHKDIS